MRRSSSLSHQQSLRRPSQHVPLVEFETRWDYADPPYEHGIAENFSIDQSLHSLFGASKVAADVLVQEYGRYFGMPTCCLPRRLPDRPEPFRRRAARLPQLSRSLQSRRAASTRFSATRGSRCATISTRGRGALLYAFAQAPRIGRGLQPRRRQGATPADPRSASHGRALTGKRHEVHYVDQNRIGDHICYYSDLRKMRATIRSGTSPGACRRRSRRSSQAGGIARCWSVTPELLPRESSAAAERRVRPESLFALSVCTLVLAGCTDQFCQDRASGLPPRFHIPSRQDEDYPHSSRRDITSRPGPVILPFTFRNRIFWPSASLLSRH